MSPDPNFSWVTEIKTVDAIDRQVVTAMVENDGWLLLGTGVGEAGQLCLTFAWPAPAALTPEGVVTDGAERQRCSCSGREGRRR